MVIRDEVKPSPAAGASAPGSVAAAGKGVDGAAAAAIRALTDVRVLPSATSIRFAVLVMSLIASTGTVYASIELLTNAQFDNGVARCTPGVTPSIPLGAVLGGAAITRGALRCQLPYFASMGLWTLAGIFVVLCATLVTHAVSSWWLIHLTRPWSPIGRRRGVFQRRWEPRRPWWIPGAPQALSRLREDRPDQKEALSRIRLLAAQAGLSTPPDCWRAQYARKTDARAFTYRGRGSIRLNQALIGLASSDQAADNAVFDGIVLHEIGHLLNRDCRQTSIAYAAWRAFVVLALLPFLIALVDPGLLTDPFSGKAFAFRAPVPAYHLYSSIAILTALVYLSRSAVLRARETHADARAWLIEPNLIRAAIQRGLDEGRVAHQTWSTNRYGELRDRAGSILALHPSRRRRLADLGEISALTGREGLATFGAGAAAGLVAANVYGASLLAVFSAAQRPLTESGLYGRLIHDVFTGQPAATLVVFLLAYGPALLATLPVLVGFATSIVWRAKLGAFDARRPAVLRYTLALALGYVVAEPMSFVYALSGYWAIVDSGTWIVIDICVSVATMLLLCGLLFQWAAESAAAWIPVVPADRLRRTWRRATLVGTLGATPLFFTWLFTHESFDITVWIQFASQPPVDSWPFHIWALRYYLPLSYINLLPGGIVAIALPALFTVAGWSRGRAAELARRIRALLRGGVALGAAIAVIGAAVLLVFRLVIGAAAMAQGVRGNSGFPYLFGIATGIAALVSAVATVFLHWRMRERTLSGALAVVFLGTSLAAPFLTAAVLVSGCGTGAVRCATGSKGVGLLLYGRIGAAAPLEGALAAIAVTALATVVTAAINRVRRVAFAVTGTRIANRVAHGIIHPPNPSTSPSVSPSPATAVDERHPATALLALILVTLCAGAYCCARYILFR